MSLGHPRSTGIYRYCAPVRDKERPNFIFSSNIPFKIATCVAELHLYQGGFKPRRVDLAKYISSFEVTLELNALLLRHGHITPSELVQNNSIFVAKSKRLRHKSTLNNSVSLFPGVWNSILSTQKENETFVITFSLQLDELSIDLAKANDINLHFHANQTFEPLLRSDPTLTKHLESYIRHKLLQELKSNSDITIHIADSSTILQDSPRNESIAQFKCLSGASHEDALELVDTSLDEGDVSYVIEKQLVFYDEDDEYNVTGDEMKLLHSDESGKCHSNEDEDSDFAALGSLQMDRHIADETENLLGNKTYSSSESQPCKMGLSREKEENVCPNNTDTGLDLKNTGYENILPSFDSEGHSDAVAAISPAKNTMKLTEFKIDTDLPELSAFGSISLPKDIFSETGQNGQIGQGVQNGQRGQSDPSSFDDFCRDIDDCDSEMDDLVSSPIVSPRKRNTQGTTSGNPGDPPTLKKKASHSFIDHDDGHGLKFAFRDSSSSVPEYIKENKKFKFIKVGKVQKFVNMFEEHLDPASNPSSRMGTRPGSPAKQID